jgi:phospholipase C
VFDHTTIIKAILARFCRKANGTVPDMGARVRAAEQFGALLGEKKARPAPARSDYQHLIDQARDWGEKLAAHTVLPTPEGLLAPAAHLTDFQEDFVTARQAVLGLRGAAKKIAALKSARVADG